MDMSSDDRDEISPQVDLNSNLHLKRSEMNQLIMDYLVHEGFKEAAERFREEAGIEPVNLRLLPEVEAPFKAETSEMLDRRVDVRHLIENSDILKAQSLINLYYPELLDIHKDLYFRLQQQHLIELIRQQRTSDVLSYVHNQLSVDELKDLTEIEKTLALLAYDQPDKSPYSGLLQPARRLQLASEINDTILQETVGNIALTGPKIAILLKLLFWTQVKLEKKEVQFSKMTDLANGTILKPRH